jgi:hypothetical protein
MAAAALVSCHARACLDAHHYRGFAARPPVPSFNRLSGPLPKELGPGLEQLRLGHNALEGPVPEWVALKNLRVLDLRWGAGGWARGRAGGRAGGQGDGRVGGGRVWQAGSAAAYSPGLP